MPTWHQGNYWTEDNTDAYLPRYAGYNASLKSTPQTRYLQNVAYIRLKNLEIGYSFRIPGVPINNIRVYANGYNLLTFTSFKANDPEAQAGFGSTRYPMTRVYNFGINLNF